MWAIYKKELKTYFLSPIGYVFIGLFLFMASMFFYADILVTGSTMFSSMFYSLSTILIMIVPLLTMRMFSEERKEGTEQLLLTAPRSITSIVLGKFFAGLIVLIIAAIFGYAIWDANKNLNEAGSSNIADMPDANDVANKVTNEVANQNNVNEEINPNTNKTNTNTTNYVGEWYISEEAYMNAERIDSIMDRREDNMISDTEFEAEMQSEANTNIVELDVDKYFQNTISFDFILTSPAPTQREGKLDDIVVNLEGNTGTFTYTDNWGTSGNGTITLNDNSIELRLETTKASQSALWGVEGIYTFSYKRMD